MFQLLLDNGQIETVDFQEQHDKYQSGVADGYYGRPRLSGDRDYQAGYMVGRAMVEAEFRR